MLFGNSYAFFAFIPLLCLIVIILLKGRNIKNLPLIFGFVFFILGLSRPELGHYELSHSSEPSSLIIMIDTSYSMTARDVLPSRIGLAVELAKNLIISISDVRVAIFPFASDGFLQLPFTTDIDAACDVLNSLDTSLHSDPGTDIGVSLERLFKILIKLQERAVKDGRFWNNPNVVLFSDGENHEKFRENILSRYRAKKIEIHTVLVGREAGASITISERNRFYTVRTQANKKILQKISYLTNGHYIEPDINELDKIKTLISQKLKMSKVVSRFKTETELFPLFFLISFLFFTVDVLLGKWNYVLRIAFAFFISTSAMASESNKKSDIDYFNMAIKEVKNGNLSSASMYFQYSAFLTENPVLKKKAFYNLANTLFKMGELENAIEIYQLAYDVETKNKDFNKNTNKQISENIVLAMRLFKKAKKGCNRQKESEITDPLRPQKYKPEIFSKEQKEKFFKIIQNEELEIYRSKKVKKDYTGKPW